MALKRKRGRPIRGNVKRDKNISIRMTQNEYDYIHKKSEEVDMAIIVADTDDNYDLISYF